MMVSTKLSSVLALALGAQALVSTSTKTRRPQPSLAAAPVETEVSYKPLYGESSRKFRRTQYKGPADWVKHRRPTRFFNTISTMPQSGVVRSLKTEVGTVCLVALFVLMWNAAAVDDFGPLPPMLPVLGLPQALFSLSSPALGLLLVFRTNASFSRWFEARGAWGRIINSSRNVVRQLVAWQPRDVANPEQRKADVMEAAALTSASARTLQLHFQREAGRELNAEDFAAALLEPTNLPLPAAEALFIGNAKNRPVAALTRASVALKKASMYFPDQRYKLPEIDEGITVLFDQLGCCERLYGSPVPLVYTRLTSRFVSVWLLLLPFALANRAAPSPDLDHLAHFMDSLTLLPECALIATFFFGIDELAIQLEEPFTILPLDFLCGGIDNALKEITTNMPGEENDLEKKQ